MKQRKNTTLYVGIGFLIVFLIWTLLVRTLDRQGIGPEGSTVGFASLNHAFFTYTGVHFSLYLLTDWLSLLPLGLIFGFALWGLCQWIRRKSLWRVDFDILVLGGFYAAVLTIYLLFEFVVINYRPVLIEGVLEASYPSSTTMLVLCVMLTAWMILQKRILNKTRNRLVCILILAFTAFMVMGRLVSGVHWITDIIGGILLSAGLVTLYRFFSRLK